MSEIFHISSCNISQMIGESSRFMFHTFLVHISTNIIEGKKDLFTKDLFKSLIITALAIILYHVFFRKIIDPNIEKMKLICFDPDKRMKKKLKIENSDLHTVSRKITKSYNNNKKNKKRNKIKRSSDYYPDDETTSDSSE